MLTILDSIHNIIRNLHHFPSSNIFASEFCIFWNLRWPNLFFQTQFNNQNYCLNWVRSSRNRAANLNSLGHSDLNLHTYFTFKQRLLSAKNSLRMDTRWKFEKPWYIVGTRTSSSSCNSAGQFALCGISPLLSYIKCGLKNASPGVCPPCVHRLDKRPWGSDQ